MNNLFDNLLTLEEASKEWEIKDSDILENILSNIFIQGQDVKKFDNTWLISRQAMEREYGKINEEASLIMSNMPYANMRYESYIRNAFDCERGQDPAELSNGDVFDIAREEKYFYRAKAAASYAALIYNNRIFKEFSQSLKAEERAGLENLAKDITNSNNKDELYENIDMHNSLILNIEDRD